MIGKPTFLPEDNKNHSLLVCGKCNWFSEPDTFVECNPCPHCGREDSVEAFVGSVSEVRTLQNTRVEKELTNPCPIFDPATIQYSIPLNGYYEYLHNIFSWELSTSIDGHTAYRVEYTPVTYGTWTNTSVRTA